MWEVERKSRIVEFSSLGYWVMVVPSIVGRPGVGVGMRGEW